MAHSDVAGLVSTVCPRIMAAEWQGTGMPEQTSSPKDKLQLLGPAVRGWGNQAARRLDSGEV